MRYRTPGRAALALLAALAAAACIREPDPFTLDTNDVAVHMILEAGADSVVAIVERPEDPIEDAIVRLSADGDTTLLAYGGTPCYDSYFQGPEGGCFRASLAAPIRAGATYDLEVILPDGGRVTGTTTVPMPLALTEPSDGDRVVADCDSADACYGQSTDEPPFYLPVAEVTFRWADPVDPDAIQMSVRPLRTFLDGQEYGPEEGCRLGYFGFRAEEAGTDSLTTSIVWPVLNISCPEPLQTARFDSIHADARVYFWNEAYDDYLDVLTHGGTTRDAGLSVGLTGAWGIFAAVAPAQRTITVVRDPPL